LRSSAQQPKYGLPARLAHQIPQRNIQRADGSHGDAFASECHRLPIHLLPQELDVPRIGSKQHWLQIEFNYLLGNLW